MDDLKQLNNLIIFNQDGKIIYMTGESYGHVNRPSITHVDFLEIPYGSIDYKENIIIGVDIKNKKPILKKIEIPLTEEDKRVQELEKQNADLAYKLMIGEM